MLIRKRLLILANSYKYGGRCIAGRELLPSGDVGGWVRPVSREHDGALMWHQCLCPNGHLLRVGDVAEVALVGHAGDAHQPANWLLPQTGKWEKPPECLAPPLRLLVERPGDLWMQSGLMNTDRATVEHVAAHPPAQSLYL